MGFNENQVALLVVPMALWALATVAIVLRLVARRVRSTAFDLSDLLIIFSWILLLALAVILVAFVTVGGGGQHVDALSPQQLQMFSVLFYASEIVYFVNAPVLKSSFVIFYRRLFPVAIIKRTTTIMIYLLGAWGVAIVLTGLFQCAPISKAWNPVEPGTCIQTTSFLYAVQSINVAFDIAIFVMPLPVLWGIQRPKKAKLALVSLFSLAGIGVAAAIVRVVMLGQINTADITYTAYEAAIWTSVEPSIGIMCASLPIIRGLFSRGQVETSQKGYRSASRSWTATKLKLLHRSRGSASWATESRESGPYKIMVSHDIEVQRGSF